MDREAARARQRAFEVVVGDARRVVDDDTWELISSLRLSYKDLPAALDLLDRIEALAAEWEADAREGLDSDADPYCLALAASLRATLEGS
jgi:hypothetical protein